MTFDCLTNDELADIWYTLAGAEIRHPGCFTTLLEQSHAELVRRLGAALAPFVEEQFRRLRPTDQLEDLEASERAASESGCA